MRSLVVIEIRQFPSILNESENHEYTTPFKEPNMKIAAEARTHSPQSNLGYMLTLVLILLSSTAIAQNAPLSQSSQDTNADSAFQTVPWTGRLTDGTVITRDDLTHMLAEHNLWFASQQKKGKRLVLDNAVLPNVILDDADLTECSMRGTFLWRAKIRNATLWRADLTGAMLVDAQLTGSELDDVNFSNANLQDARLNRTRLVLADFNNANLRRADFNGALLYQVRLKNARLNAADFTDSRFDIAELPEIGALTGLRGLDSLKFHPQTQRAAAHALDRLRQTYRNAGLNAAADQITYSIWNFYNARDDLRSRINRILFKSTCEYGLEPAKPLILALIAFPVFALVYFIISPPSADSFTTRCTHSIILSLQSGLNIGIGNTKLYRIIQLMQPNPKPLECNNYLRIVTGLQNILSAYLIILWIALIVAHPFG